MISLKDIKKVKITNKFSSYSMFLYGPAKIGKSTFVHDIYGDKVLFLMTEPRYRSLVGADILEINSWADYLSIIKQLKRDKGAHEQYDVIAIDTVDNLWSMLNTYLTAQFDENTIGERNDLKGQDWIRLKQEWSDGINLIHRAGFTSVFISHDTTKKIKVVATPEMQQDPKFSIINQDGIAYAEVDQVQPDLDHKGFNPLNKLVDIIANVDKEPDEDGNLKRVLHLRGNNSYIAGNTFGKAVPETIPFTKDAFQKAIDTGTKEFGSDEITEDNYHGEKKQEPFEDLMTRVREEGVKLAKAGYGEELQEIVEQHFGVNAKLTDATEKQRELVEAAEYDIQEAIKSHK